MSPENIVPSYQSPGDGRCMNHAVATLLGRPAHRTPRVDGWRPRDRAEWWARWARWARRNGLAPCLDAEVPAGVEGAPGWAHRAAGDAPDFVVGVVPIIMGVQNHAVVVRRSPEGWRLVHDPAWKYKPHAARGAVVETLYRVWFEVTT